MYLSWNLAKNGKERVKGSWQRRKWEKLDHVYWWKSKVHGENATIREEMRLLMEAVLRETGNTISLD